MATAATALWINGTYIPEGTEIDQTHVEGLTEEQVEALITGGAIELPDETDADDELGLDEDISEEDADKELGLAPE